MGNKKFNRLLTANWSIDKSAFQEPGARWTGGVPVQGLQCCLTDADLTTAG